MSRSTPRVGACADIEGGTFTSGWSATLQSLGCERGPLEMAGAPGAHEGLPLQPVVPARPTGKHREPPAGSVPLSASTGKRPAHDSPSATRIELGPGASQRRWYSALPGIGATLGELVRRRTVDGGDALWSFGR
jgi:hypothetical protein